MSINVTVTGNPVSIKRGKMVTADPDFTKNEFQRRRRMRLEQVRQQSKDIAGNVRSKVHKEKTKRLLQREQEGANKLKEWQSQKLIELQQQHCKNLKDIGLGHTGAVVEETREDLVNAYKGVLREKSKERGHVAATQLHDEKEDNMLAQARKSQQRKDVRNLENTRSGMVSKIRMRTQYSPFKKKKEKKPITNINISSVIDNSESSLDSDVSIQTEESSDNYMITSPHKLKPETKDIITTSLSTTESPKKGKTRYEKQIIKNKRKSSPETKQLPPGSPEPTKYLKKIPPSPQRPFNFPLDTRISDRIKRRLNIPLNQSISKNYLQKNVISRVTQSDPIMDEVSTQTEKLLLSVSVQSNSELQFPSDICCQCCNHPSVDEACELCRSKENIQKSPVRKIYQPCGYKENVKKSSVSRPCDNIPERPRISLKSSGENNLIDSDFNKVQFYDHVNRYSKDYLCNNSCVQKIQDDTFQICPSVSSEQEFMEKIYKRDRDALERGKKATEKEKIHRDYKEMMQQLPILQRQERIASINSNNPLFHISDERLKLHKLKRQNQMEEAYEKYFPNAPLITVPPKKHDVHTKLFHVVDVSNNQPAVNLATWDVDSVNKDVIVTKDDGLISVSTETTQDQTKYLKNLLEKLKMQKQMLIREINSLPKDSNLHNLIKKMGSTGESRETQQRSNLHKLGSGIEKKMTSSAAENYDYYYSETGLYNSKDSEDVKKLTKKVSSHHLRTKHKILLSSSNSSLSPLPRKKSKYRKYTLVLQNTSTQTTPKEFSPAWTKSLESRTIQQPHKQTIFTDTKHFEIQIGEDTPKSPKEKPALKTIASSQTCFMPQIKVLRNTTLEKDKVESITAPFKTDEKDKKRKTKKTHTLPPSISLRGKHTKNSLSSGVSDNIKSLCKCNDEVCEILIKIKDEEPEIVIKSPKKKQKLVKADVQKTINKKPQSKKQLQFQTVKPPDLSEDKSKSDTTKTSWKEYFNKNNSLGTSTSTSYYSPPDCRNFAKSDLSEPIDPRLLIYIKKLLTMSRASVEDLGVSSVSEISTPTPNLMNNGKNNSLSQLRNIIKYFNLNPDELARCLNSSNETDNTQESSTSSSNLFLGHHYKSEHKDINSSESNLTDHHSSLIDKNVSIKSQSDSQKYKVISAQIEKIVEQTARNIEDSTVPRVSSEAYIDQNYPSTLSEYTKITEMCYQRISNLSEMIQKVRQEKQQMLSPNISDKENSTSYMNLPSQLGVTLSALEGTTARPNTPNMSMSSSSEAEQSELTRKLLDINYSLVDKLQKLSPAELKKQVEQWNKAQTEIPEYYTDSAFDNDIITRYRALLKNDNIPSKDRPEQFEEKEVEISRTNQVIASDKQYSDIPFIPLLLDIPRLPKLTLSSTKTNSDENEEKTKVPIQDVFTELNHFEKKPPPSKGLSAAKKFNNNITNIPHELSTIVEVDSQLSTKTRQSTSPVHPDHHQAFEKIKPLVIPPDPQNLIWTLQTKVKPLSDESLPKPLSDESLPDILTELIQQPLQSHSSNSTEKLEAIHNEDQSDKIDKNDTKHKISTIKQLNMFQMSQIIADQSTDSSTEKSELENVEAMLKSMGMGWAIATIRKTQEALMRASSSSSLEISTKNQESKSSDKSNSSDVSLRQFLDKKIFTRSSGSGSKTIDSSSSPFLQELQEISAIQGSGGSSESKNQRTSTPVHTTKSSDKSRNESQKGVFLIESDLSSVKSKPDDMFQTMPGDISTFTSSQSKLSDH